jgi:flagella basal body P-ring formation protein FlgA
MRFSAFVFAALVSVVSQTQAHAITIRLERVVYFSGSALALEKVASITDCSGELARALAGRTIPVPAGICSIIPQRIVRDMAEEVANEPIVISGSRILAIPDSVPVEKRLFYEGLLAFLDSECGAREGRMEVEAEEPSILSYADSGEVPAFKLCTKRSRMGCLYGTIRLEYSLPGSGISGRCNVAVTSFLPVLAASRGIERDEALSWSNVTSRETDVASLESDALVPESVAQRFCAKTKVAPGAVLYDNIVERLFDVKARDLVRLVFHRGAIRITMPGVASASGSIGDRVAVKAAETSGRFEGTVTGTKEVTIDVAKK